MKVTAKESLIKITSKSERKSNENLEALQH
jgi:hypothetical protein